MSSQWYIYLLTNGNRTYVGATTDITRRVRQHNGEIVGGARSTRGDKWNLECYLSGFSSRSEAYRWEKIIKSRARGRVDRISAMCLVSSGLCPNAPNRTKQYPVPENIQLVYPE